MRRGFKAQAERIALELRDGLNIPAQDPVDPRYLLSSLGIIVWEPKEIPNLPEEYLEQLTVVDPDSWSGVTIRDSGQIVIVVNPTHPYTRQANTLMHEWAHIELRHKPNRVDRSIAGGLLLLSDYPKEQEDEADWLSGAILLPRDGILHHYAIGSGAAEIAQHYGVSETLANWRIRMTGVARQLSYRRRP